MRKVLTGMASDCLLKETEDGILVADEEGNSERDEGRPVSPRRGSPPNKP